MKIFELFDRPLTWTITRNSSTTKIIEFSTSNNSLYTVIIDVNSAHSGIIWEINFARITSDGKETSITNSGDQYETFSTVLNILDYFITQDPPRMIMFVGEEPSRQKLYITLSKKLAAEYGYDFRNVGGFFQLRKK